MNFEFIGIKNNAVWAVLKLAESQHKHPMHYAIFYDYLVIWGRIGGKLRSKVVGYDYTLQKLHLDMKPRFVKSFNLEDKVKLGMYMNSEIGTRINNQIEIGYRDIRASEVQQQLEKAAMWAILKV
jgi:hypothetical protein